MTLLHQAAQKAVEALKLGARHAQANARNAHFEGGREEYWADGEKIDAAAKALESALQQQPEPVARSAHMCGMQGFDGMLDICPACEARRAPPALQHQEEPREPVAVWQSQCKDGTWADCTEANARAGERYGFAARALYASPSTTRQQEVGSGWRPIESAPKDGSEMLLSNGQIVAQGWWEHQEPYIREHRDMDGRYIDQDEHDGYDGWLDFAGGMLPEPTHWMPLPAAPSTPEKAGGVSDGAGTCEAPERSAFEEWHTGKYGRAYSEWVEAKGRYAWDLTEELWTAWKAARAPAPPSPIPHPLPAQANDGGEHG